MRITSLVLAVGAALTAVPHIADASAPTITNRVWSSSGNGCVVADESAGLYDTRLAGVGFASGLIGTIRMYCPVQVSTNGTSPTFFGIGLSYNHPITNGGHASITATLWKVNDGSNSATNIDSITSTANGLGVNAAGYVGAPGPFSKTATYYVELDVVRTATDVDPEALAVFLYN